MDRTLWKGLNRWSSACLAAGALLFAGCGDATGPAGTGEVQLVLKGSGGSSAVMTSASTFEGSESSAAVSLEQVTSIDVTVVRVEVLRTGGEPEEEGGWLSLDVDAGGTIDLLALDASGIELASGELPAGTYRNLRLFLEPGAMITFAEEVNVGPHTYEADQPYELSIPSAEQTGVKTINVSFTVEEGSEETVVLEFDAGVTVRNLTATGMGKIIMNPVLTRGEG